jgi:proline dehydrogenase
MLNRFVVGSIGRLPSPMVATLARRYIAGPNVDDALNAVRSLAALGCVATVDVLGEDDESPDQWRRNCEAYQQLLERIDSTALPAGVSVKLSSLGLSGDRDDCRSRLEAVALAARSHGRFVRVDMEDSRWTSATLDVALGVYQSLPNVGVVVQACLLRSPADVERLVRHGVSVRLCKGAYRESSAVAYQSRSEIRRAYLVLLEELLAGHGFVAVATHDELLIDGALDLIRRRSVPPGRYEFQLLLGVAERRRAGLVRCGHRVRVYVPFGGDWYAYSMRRLRENPQLTTAVIAGALGRMLRPARVTPVATRP